LAKYLVTYLNLCKKASKRAWYPINYKLLSLEFFIN
jgi:hypothetical protein